jgi:hypothetical protein
MLKAKTFHATFEELPLSHMMKGFSKWRNVLVRACFFGILVILANLVLVYFFGSQIWSSAGYLFGDELRITLSVLLFIEGGVLLATGSLWASGSMENVHYGKYNKTPAFLNREDWQQRKEQTQSPSNAVKILLLMGCLLLISAFLLLLM